MARIEGIRIRNYRALRDITLGKLWNDQRAHPLSPVTAVIGANGSGKSTLFDVFGFLADCLKEGVEKACDARGRGGFERILSQGSDGPLSFELYYREAPRERPITYELAIDLDGESRPYVVKERLRQRRKGQSKGRPFSFLILNGGKGAVWVGAAEGARLSPEEEESLDSRIILNSSDVETADRESVELTDRRRLGIATLGAMRQHPRISAFREFVERWYLSYFSPDAARSLPLAGPEPHLNTRGDNLGNVVQHMEREHPQRLRKVLQRIAQRIPGVRDISTQKTEDGRLLLRFNDRGFRDPFYAQQMSDGTLKLFAYLLLLEETDPHPFIGIEEPENGLYPKLLQALVQELRAHAQKRGGSQVFITTHQPQLVDALSPDEVWVLRKKNDGFSAIHRANEDITVRELVAEEIPLGGLWLADYLDTPGLA